MIVTKAAAESDICVKAQLFAELFARTELFVGSARPDGSVVTELDFDRRDGMLERSGQQLRLEQGYSASAMRATFITTAL